MTTGPAPITGKDWQNHVEPRIMAEDLRALEQGIQQALDGGGGVGMVPIFQSLAEAQAWEAANPGRTALHLGGAAPPPGDTTNPVAGALSASAQTETGFTLTVVGASDDTALHAQPYAFSTDNGSTWSGWQSSPSRTITGLTAGTTYQARHKVRDAAGNEALGAAISVTTEAAAPSNIIAADTFDRADGPLGTTPVGGKTWLQGGTTMHSVVNNVARATGTAVSYVETGTTAHRASAVLVETGRGTGVAVRVTSDNATLEGSSLYRAVYLSGKFYLTVSGDMTQATHVQELSRTASAGDTISLAAEDNGSGGVELTVLHDGTAIITHTETETILNGTGAGIFTSGGSNPASINNFEVVAL